MKTMDLRNNINRKKRRKRSAQKGKNQKLSKKDYLIYSNFYIKSLFNIKIFL